MFFVLLLSPKELAMSDVKHSLIEEVYRSAQRCYTEANETVASLDRAITNPAR